MKKTLVVLLAVLVLFTSEAYASEYNSLTKNIIVTDEGIEQIIQSYFDAREAALNDFSGSENYKRYICENFANSEEIVKKETNWANARKNIEEKFEITILNCDISHSICSEKTIAKQGKSVKVYEWVSVEYICGEAEFVDVMGYGTWHEMVFDKTRKEEYCLVSDIYNDDDITSPACLNNAPMVNDNSIEEQQTSLDLIPNSGINIFELINYSDEWVGHNGEFKCNPDYGTTLYSQKIDCANYASQCLYEAGMSTDTNWHIGAYNWTFAPGLYNYLLGLGYTSAYPTNSSVIPGGLMFFSTTTNIADIYHVAICVGYNQNGVPYFNSHTNDRYHIPLSNTFRGIKVVNLFSSNPLTDTPQNAEVINITSQLQWDQELLYPGNCKYYKIEKSTNVDDYYYVYLGSSCYEDTHMYVLQQLVTTTVPQTGATYGAAMYERAECHGSSPSISGLRLNRKYNYYIWIYQDGTYNCTHNLSYREIT